jgi:hypothetical protein
LAIGQSLAFCRTSGGASVGAGECVDVLEGCTVDEGVEVEGEVVFVVVEVPGLQLNTMMSDSTQATKTTNFFMFPFLYLGLFPVDFKYKLIVIE